MTVADEHDRSPGEPEQPAPVDRSTLEAARRRHGLLVPAADAAWTACAGPANLWVVDTRGNAGACEFGPCGQPAPGRQPTWDDTTAAIRAALATNSLPLPHCRSCVAWLADDLFASAPPIRDYGGLPMDAAAHARQLVVRLGDGETAFAPAVLATIRDALPTLEGLILETSGALDGPAAQEALALLRSRPDGPRLTLRIAHPAAVAGALRALEPLQLAAVEVTMAADAPDLLRAVVALGRAKSARIDARFVFGPDNWFQFEEVARACAAAGVMLDLRVLDRDGRVPLDQLSSLDLALVKDVLLGTWPRCGGTVHPGSLTDFGFDHVCQQVRALLHRRLVREQAGAAAAASPSAQLAMPAVDHPWATDPERRTWWLQTLFGHADHAAVRAWIQASSRGSAGAASVRQHTWLRALVQREVAQGRYPEGCELLRQLYGASSGRKALLHDDRELAEAIDLTTFGGPWNEPLGLAGPMVRKRPFQLGKARTADSTPPRVTVLIPSYRHEAFIEETMRSVLAQRCTAFRLLVVDDGSPDATVERARSVSDPRVEIRVNERNLGLGNSVLQALATIDTPFVALLNSDDLFHPDRLARCLEVLEGEPTVQLVTTGLQLVDRQGGHLTADNTSLVLDGKLVHDWVHWFARAWPATQVAGDDLFGALLERNFLVTSSNMVARTDWLRSCAEQLRSLKYCLDWRLFLEAALQRVLRHLPEPLLAYRLHDANTVWFDAERRYSYYLEVHRVAAEALARHATIPTPSAAGEMLPVLRDVVLHASANTEVDGFGLFLHRLVDALELDAAASADPEVRQLVQRLEARAARRRDGPPAEAPRTRPDYDRMLGELAREQAESDRHQRRWLHSHVETLEKRLAESWTIRCDLEATLRRRHDEWTAERDQANSRATAQQQRIESLERRSEVQDKDLAALRAAVAAVDALHRMITEELAVVRAEREALRTRSTDLAAALAAESESLRAARAEVSDLATMREDLTQSLRRSDAELATARERIADTERRLLTTSGDLEQERTRSNSLEADKQQLAGDRVKLRGELLQLDGQLQQLRGSREFRLGNFFWNKMPLGYLSRRGKKWLRRLLDAKDRAAMAFRRRRRAQGVAVVAACWQWPVYSHTFVYQEMIGLTHMGLDVQMFHWDLGDTGQLHQAFSYLADHRTQLQPIWENHVRDKAHFDKTKPGRLRAFLELVAARTGRNVEDLEQEPIVLQGCTLARMAELAGARYLHSYFFYDQSFMMMQAAWLLDIPRGVSCYADHMLDDYPFKLVDLHVELASVIVATSARIKRELSQKSGGRFDDKIIVKPNGVDGARFPAFERPERKQGDVFEVVSISRIEPKKGLIHLIEAIAELKKRGHKIVAHVIGSKDPHSKGSLEYAADFERRIRELGLEQEVVLHGMKRQEELPPILQRSRAFVAPYVEIENGDKDGIPTAMLEGLASGLPVVTTDSGSILEVVDHEVEGLVVPQRDSAAFAEALERLIEDPALERRMAKAARARFTREFDIRVTEKRLHERVAALVRAQDRAR